MDGISRQARINASTYQITEYNVDLPPTSSPLEKKRKRGTSLQITSFKTFEIEKSVQLSAFKIFIEDVEE